MDLREVGLSNRSGEVKFDRVGKKNRGANKISATGTHVIQVTTGDDALPLRGERIAIKLDVEEHEIEAIEGMRELLRQSMCSANRVLQGSIAGSRKGSWRWIQANQGH